MTRHCIFFGNVLKRHVLALFQNFLLIFSTLNTIGLGLHTYIYVYVYIYIAISFWYRLRLNFKSLIQLLVILFPFIHVEEKILLCVSWT